MRPLLLAALAACGPSPYADDLPLGTFCVRLKGQEHCAEGVIGQRTGDGIAIDGLVVVPEMQLGRDRVPVRIDATLDGQAVIRASVDVALAMECELVQAHGDHCHPSVVVPMACALPVEGDDAELSIDRLTDTSVYLRFSGLWEGTPPCCENECAWHIPATADPQGPYRFTGVAHVALE